MGLVSGSLRSDPRRFRAARRASLPAVRIRRPSPGRHHPAPVPDVRAALIAVTGVPDADAMMIIARRTRIDSCVPRRTICCAADQAGSDS
jgi:hypothetical protein